MPTRRRTVPYEHSIRLSSATRSRIGTNSCGPEGRGTRIRCGTGSRSHRPGYGAAIDVGSDSSGDVDDSARHTGAQQRHAQPSATRVGDNNPRQDFRRAFRIGSRCRPQEYLATDTVFDPPRHRKERLAEGVEIIRRLIDGHRVDFSGDHYAIEGAQIDSAVQDHLPILVGGNGEALLSHAGAHADIIGLQGLSRTRPDGHRHSVNWHPDWLTTQIEQVRTGAGSRFGQIELNALVQVVEITDDRDSALAAICERVEGLDPHHAGQIPYLLVGTVGQIAEHILACRQRWGISYYAVRELDAFAEVINAVKAAS
jgi:hypothetical protein